MEIYEEENLFLRAVANKNNIDQIPLKNTVSTMTDKISHEHRSCHVQTDNQQ